MNSEGLNSEVLDNDLPQAEVVAETPVVETPPPAPIQMCIRDRLALRAGAGVGCIALP